MSNKIQACEFTLLRVYLALLSISPAFLDSSMCALYNIVH